MLIDNFHSYGNFNWPLKTIFTSWKLLLTSEESFYPLGTFHWLMEKCYHFKTFFWRLRTIFTLLEFWIDLLESLLTTEDNFYSLGTFYWPIIEQFLPSWNIVLHLRTILSSWKLFIGIWGQFLLSWNFWLSNRAIFPS